MLKNEQAFRSFQSTFFMDPFKDRIDFLKLWRKRSKFSVAISGHLSIATFTFILADMKRDFFGDNIVVPKKGTVDGFHLAINFNYYFRG